MNEEDDTRDMPTQPYLEPVADIAEKEELDPGVVAIRNLLAEQLVPFLARQEQRDERMERLVRDAIDEAMVNRHEIIEARRIADEANRRSQDNAEQIAKIQRHLGMVDGH